MECGIKYLNTWNRKTAVLATGLTLSNRYWEIVYPFEIGACICTSTVHIGDLPGLVLHGKQLGFERMEDKWTCNLFHPNW